MITSSARARHCVAFSDSAWYDDHDDRHDDAGHSLRAKRLGLFWGFLGIHALFGSHLIGERFDDESDKSGSRNERIGVR